MASSHRTQRTINFSEELRDLQQRSPVDLSVAHDLGLAELWLVTSSGDLLPNDHDVHRWHRFIANWAVVLENDEYWDTWTKERALCYGETISSEAQSCARGMISERVVHLLVAHDQAKPMIAGRVSLDLLFYLETKAIQLLKRSRGFAVSGDSLPKLFCGPLMVEQLGIHDKVSQVVWSLQGPPGEANDLLQILRRMMAGNSDALDMVDGRHRRNLMQCYSQLGPAFAALDRSDPHKALELLASITCSECHGYIPGGTIEGSGLVFPRTCDGQCVRFAAMNPAYALLRDRGEALFRHAVELMAEVFMALAEQDIRAQPPKIDEATAHWQDAIQAARAIGFESQFLDTLVTTTLARSTTLTQGQHLDEGVALLQAVQPLTDDERVVGKLAELLTDRGVKKGNEQQWDGAVEDLRSALSFNPHSVRARNNLLTALRGAAATAHEAEDTTTARQHLQEARSVLRSGLEMDGDNSGWRQEMIEVEFELLAVEGGSSDGESGGLAALLGGLMAMLGSAQDSTDSAEAMHLMAEAADKAAAQDFAEALRLTERALELDPESPLLLRGLASMTNNYGVQLAEQDQFEQAIQVLQEGVRRFPDHADLQRNLQSVQRADELRRLTSEGSPLEALEALLRVLAEDSGAGVATQPTQEPPRLAPPATGRNRFTELAEAGRAKRERGDLPGAIADLEQALSLAPEHQDIRRSLADTMEKHADALIAQGRRDEGLAVARRGLMYVPDHAGLKMTLALASLGQSGTEGNSTDASAPEAALRTLFEGLARAAASTAGEVQPLKNGPAEPGAAARASVLLQETELKYQERGSNRYALPFRTEHRDRMVAQLQVVHDLAVVSTPVTAGSVDESALLYSLLRATFTGDYFKACRSSQGQMFLVAETPVGVLSAKSLEEIIRDLVSFADVPDADLTSAERLASHIGSVQAARRMGEGLGASGGGLFGFLRRKSLDESAQRLVEFSRTAGVECQRVADNRYRLKVGLTGLNVLAICKGSAISFIASFGDMRPARGNLRFYRRVTEINMELDVWKIALDSDDDVAFLYELPALDEDTFERMTDGLDQHLMRYGFELTLLARTGA